MMSHHGRPKEPATQPITWPEPEAFEGGRSHLSHRERPRVVLVDHGFANTMAVDRMLRRAQIRPMITSEPGAMATASHIILPGVGHFDAVRNRLGGLGFLKALTEARERGAAFLGICVGMQLMFDGSDEGVAEGLGWIKGRCRRLAPGPDSGARVPQMGWNRVVVVGQPEIFGSGMDEEKFYFLHSYAAEPDDPGVVIGRCRYGGSDVVAAVRIGRSFGVQFHPEKSHRFGLNLLKRFVQQ